MEFLNVLAAAIAGFAFGAVWYMSLAKPWKAATGMTDEIMQSAGAKLYIISFIALLIVAGMMHHMFALAGIESAGKGLTAELGLGLFIAPPHGLPQTTHTACAPAF